MCIRKSKTIHSGNLTCVTPLLLGKSNLILALGVDCLVIFLPTGYRGGAHILIEEEELIVNGT